MKQEWEEAAKAYANENEYLNLDENEGLVYIGWTIEEAFLSGIEWHNRSLNWVRDLVKAGIEKPEEAVDILKRIDVLLNTEE